MERINVAEYLEATGPTISIRIPELDLSKPPRLTAKAMDDQSERRCSKQQNGQIRLPGRLEVEALKFILLGQK